MSLISITEEYFNNEMLNKMCSNHPFYDDVFIKTYAEISMFKLLYKNVTFLFDEDTKLFIYSPKEVYVNGVL